MIATLFFVVAMNTDGLPRNVFITWIQARGVKTKMVFIFAKSENISFSPKCSFYNHSANVTKLFVSGKFVTKIWNFAKISVFQIIYVLAVLSSLSCPGGQVVFSSPICLACPVRVVLSQICPVPDIRSQLSCPGCPA
jgi:hypothetical protein